MKLTFDSCCSPIERHKCADRPDFKNGASFSGSNDASHREVKAGPLQYPIDITTETNSTFSDGLCALLNSNGVTTSLTVYVTGDNLGNLRYVFPDCAFQYLADVTVLELSYVIVQPNASTSDSSWIRLASSLSSAATSLGLFHSRMVDLSGDDTVIVWDTLFAALPSANRLQIDHMILKAGLPPQLPERFNYFTVASTDLSGSLPDSFLGQFSASTTVVEFYLTLYDNKLVGALPSNFLGDLPQTLVTSIGIDLSANGFSSDIPFTTFAGNWTAMEHFQISLQNNQFTGLVANALQSTSFGGALNALTLTFNNNKFSGSLPTSWFFDSVPSSGLAYDLDISNNQIAGAIMSSTFSILYPGVLTSVKYNIRGNAIESSLPLGLFEGLSNALHVDIDFSSNRMDGTISTDLFLPLPWNTLVTFTLDAHNNSFYGDIPSNLCNYSRTNALEVLNVDFSSNPYLTGSIPSSFWESLLPAQSGGYSVPTTIASISFANSGLTGALEFPNFSLRKKRTHLYVDASYNSFDTLTFVPGSQVGFFNLTVSGNTALNGTLPDALFQPTSTLSSLLAANTLLHFDMPHVEQWTPVSITELDLSGTNIDFCSGNRTTWNPSPALVYCNLTHTNAGLCSDLFPQCHVSAIVSPTSPTSPTSGCAAATRPSLEFQCVGSTWTFFGTITTPVLTIPAGATQTVIEGNVTSTSVVINGLGSTIIVHGCATNLSLITVTLTPEELKQIGNNPVTQALISVNASECGNLNTVAVTTHVKGKSCRKVASKSFEKDGTLSGVFTVNSSGCNTWWIVLVSVVGGIILLVIIIAVAVSCIKARLFKKASKHLTSNAKKAVLK